VKEDKANQEVLRLISYTGYLEKWLKINNIKNHLIYVEPNFYVNAWII